MTKKIIYFVPVLMIIVSIITSIVAFVYSEKLENGYIYIEGDTINTTIDGEYFALIGNLGESSAYISVDSLTSDLLITIYDINKSITREYTLQVKKENTVYSKEIINDYIGTDLVKIEDIDEYIFKLDLDENETYETILLKTNNNIESEEVDLVFINLPENLLNMKNLNEGIAFTTFIFAIISGFTILSIWYVKKSY